MPAHVYILPGLVFLYHSLVRFLSLTIGELDVVRLVWLGVVVCLDVFFGGVIENWITVFVGVLGWYVLPLVGLQKAAPTWSPSEWLKPSSSSGSKIGDKHGCSLGSTL
ncbi:hypothetical protein DSO57_1022224 [Entomophthora muscae]|uniref:Uncharacterized protein n=1 Tax=Entomophthora muscae TaxID=34485 RepID=A0ACC2SSD2_9FUNG|nr:hypothetical protein DSO57_1022224 [Entomophthora muscae]